MKIDYSVSGNAASKLREIGDRVADTTPLMTMMGRHMMPSIRTNFLVGGRPTWEQLQTIVVGPRGSRSQKYRRVQGRTRLGGPLVLTGDLRNHISFVAEKLDLILTASPTPGVKGPVHQYGATGAGRGHNVMIPARPYLVFQPEDIAWFKAAAEGWIRVGQEANA